MQPLLRDLSPLFDRIRILPEVHLSRHVVDRDISYKLVQAIPEQHCSAGLGVDQNSIFCREQ